MNACVIGLGKIGLPLSVQFARNGVNVTGVDINQVVIDSVNNGEVPFTGEPKLDIHLKEVTESRKFKATSDFEVGITNADVVIVLVPLSVDSQGTPDFTSIDSVVDQIAKYMTRDLLVIFETTLPIGTTRNRFGRRLENLTQQKIGKDFYVAFSPERVSSGRIFEDLRNYPKIVGGLTIKCTEKAVEFYELALDFNHEISLVKPNGVWSVANTETSEFIKLAETTYRDVNIALANQFMIHSEELGLDILEIIMSANSQPFSHIHSPGIAVGGHCIPVYPHFYMSTDPDATIVQAAREQNMKMPNYYLAKIRNLTQSLKGLNILILGLAYRPNVKEHAFSGAITLVKLIEKEGGFPFVVDPLYTDSELEEIGLKVRFDKRNIDFAILHTSHDVFENYPFNDMINLKGIVDGRNFYDPESKKIIIL
jgi:UDP-N-acetyl-D-glucosamine dehydrogenase